MTSLLIGGLPSGWEATTLGDVCARGGGNIQTGPFGSQLHAADYVPLGIPSIMPQNIGDNRIATDGIARITPGDADRLSRYLVRPGDIVYSRRGDVERRALIRDEQDGWLCGTGCLRLRVGEGVVDPAFAAFYLAHPAVRAWITQHAVGATMPNLNTAILSAVPFAVPPMDEQRRIAGILGALDDKIELNRQMSRTLESIARAVFTSWFVDFDPVRKKMEGGGGGGPPPPAAHFPRSFEESPIGPVPTGWAVGIVGDLFVLQRGFDLPKQARTPGAYLVVSAGGPSGSHCSYRVRGPGVVTGRSGRLGGVWFMHGDFWPLNTVLWVKEYCAAGPLWTYHYLQGAELGALNSGSAVPTLNRNHLHRQAAVIPPAPLVSAFEHLMQPLFAQKATNWSQSNSLEMVRDELLPRLMLGGDRSE